MRFSFLLTTLTALSFAQQPNLKDHAADRVPYELYLEALRQEPQQAALAEQREAKRQEIIFVRQANRFAELWTKFTQEFNERGTVNIKAARQAVKAFHRLEKNEAWLGSH